jgi:hypothetical protein
MPKQLVTAVGLVIAIGIVALGVFLVALPLYFQAVSVDAQTATVAASNAVYETQVDSLRGEQENLDAINQNVDGLRSQIPATGQFDDVFEVIGRAAEASGVSLTAATAGEQVSFVARTGADADESAAAVPAPQPTPTPAVTEGAVAPPTDPSSTPQTLPENVASGRQQVDFIITASAADMAQVTGFLDALRTGPRLLSIVTAVSNQTGEGTIDVQITALAYLDTEGSPE